MVDGEKPAGMVSQQTKWPTIRNDWRRTSVKYTLKAGVAFLWSVESDMGNEKIEGGENLRNSRKWHYAAARLLAMALCLSVCVCHKSVFYRNGWTNRAVSGMGASFHVSYTLYCKEIQLSSKMRVRYFPLELCSELCYSMSIVERAINLAREW